MICASSVVMAGMLVTAANSDKTLRFPVPTQPTPYNPFKYKAIPTTERWYSPGSGHLDPGDAVVDDARSQPQRAQRHRHLLNDHEVRLPRVAVHVAHDIAALVIGEFEFGIEVMVGAGAQIAAVAAAADRGGDEFGADDLVLEHQIAAEILDARRPSARRSS